MTNNSNNVKNFNKLFILAILSGIICFAFLIFHISSFHVFDDNLEITTAPYVGSNVVGRFADLLFFTYWSFILFGLWLLSVGIFGLFKNKKIMAFLLCSKVVLIISFNQIITIILYTIFQIFTGEMAQTLQIFFEYTKMVIENTDYEIFWIWWQCLYGILENLLIHYFFTTLAIAIWWKIKPTQDLAKKHSFSVLLIPIIYLIVSGICCPYLSPVWYPYPISSPEALWKTMYGSLTDYSSFHAVVILLICYIFIGIGMWAIGRLMLKRNNRKFANLNMTTN